MKRRRTIRPWTRLAAASADYKCDRCGWEIIATTIYLREVDAVGEFLEVRREHNSCPDICSEAYARS